MNTTTTLSANIQKYYDSRLLKRVEEVVTFCKYGQKRPLPRYKGKTITFTRYSSLAVATTALTEGTNPSGSNLSSTNVSATIAEYGSRNCHIKIEVLSREIPMGRPEPKDSPRLFRGRA
jgi:N4-gp56 family major capsid protein